MKVRRYLLTLFLVFFALMAAPLSAQEEASSLDEFEESTEETSADDDAESDSKKKKKKKKNKKKKGKKGSKSGKNGKDKADAEAEEESAESDKPAESAVVAAFNKFKNIGGKLNKKAEYFIYLYSASTCGHCQRCMPIAVEQYKKMKAKKVELIVICGDGTEDAAKKYLKSYKMKNPSIMFSALQATQFRGLPGCGMPGLPAISVVDKDGKMLRNVVGAQQVIDTLNDWKALTVGGK